MPPITSSRPGAREIRTRPPAARAAANSGSSARTRRSSAGTGSRLRRLGGGGGGPGGGAGGGGGGGIDNFRLLTLEDDLVGQPPPALVEPHLQHVAAIVADRRIGELKAVRPADPVPSHPLLVERLD